MVGGGQGGADRKDTNVTERKKILPGVFRDQTYLDNPDKTAAFGSMFTLEKD